MDSSAMPGVLRRQDSGMALRCASIWMPPTDILALRPDAISKGTFPMIRT